LQIGALINLKKAAALFQSMSLNHAASSGKTGRYAGLWLHNAECGFAVRSLSGKRRAPQRPAVASKTP
jgi:hypothetical protein